jgi:hypothetical protein
MIHIWPKKNAPIASIETDTPELKTRINVKGKDDNILNISAINMSICGKFHKLKAHIKEATGFNVRAQMQSEKGVVEVSVSVNSLSKKLGLTSFSEQHFIKKALKVQNRINQLSLIASDKDTSINSSDTEESLLSSESSQSSVNSEATTIHLVKEYKDLLDTNDLEESLDRLEAAKNQGIDLKEDLFKPTVDPFVPEGRVEKSSLKSKNIHIFKRTDSSNKIYKASIAIIKKLGSGGDNTVYLGWNKTDKRFIAIRSPHEDATTFENDIQKSRLIYQQIASHNTEDMELIEIPDSFLSEDINVFIETPKGPVENTKSIAYTTGYGINAFANRELAVLGDLKKAKESFSQKPKKLVAPLLKGLTMFIKAKIAIGDVKLENINVYRDPQGNALPKFSDLDGSLSTSFSVKPLVEAWKSLKTVEEPRQTELIKSVMNRTPISLTSGKERELYENLVKACKGVTKITTTQGFTMGSPNSLLNFFKENSNNLLDIFLNSSEDNYEENFTHYIENLVPKVQLLDIKATAVSIIKTLIDIDDTSYEIEDALCALLDEGENSPEAKDLVKEGINSKNNNLPPEDKLSEDSINLIMDMLCGQVLPDKGGLNRIQTLINQIATPS